MVFLVAVCAGTVALLGPIAGVPELTPETMILAALLAVLIVSADFFEIDAPLASVRVTVSVSSALCFASVITLGTIPGAAVAGLSALTVEVLQRRELIKTVLNTSNYILSTFVGGFVYFAIADPSISPIGSLNNFAATVVAASAYTLVNTGSIALVLSQVVGHSPADIWRANFRSAMLEHVSLPTMGILIPIMVEESMIALIIVVIPLLGPYLAFRSYRQIHEETRATLNVLADMLDRRDPYTADHSQRVSGLVDRMLAYYPEVSFDEYETIITAARIHDLGKVTTSDATLLKPDKLSDAEFEEMKRHAADGAAVLSHISIFQEAARVIRHHHERWDGFGYPDGLAGDEIPVGSRLIAVADTYDAMTTDRPYRQALPACVAITEIRRNSGTQFDPNAVDAFLKVIDPATLTAENPVLNEIGSSD